MKLSQEEIDRFKRMESAAKNKFSKLADFKPPDSPPPEKEKEDDDPNAPNKFDQLMKAACSIKSSQLEQQRRKFELLPSFLKAGVYYTQKHEVVRHQSDFHLKFFAYELINTEAHQEFAQRKFDRACRKYEEALSIFRYFEATDPNWQSQGIDDDHLREVDYQGHSPEERKQVREIKLSAFLNIAACNIKVKSFASAVQACDEALKLDPLNVKALYRRARATALPINAGVPELRKAMGDLNRVIKIQEQKKGRLDFLAKEKTRVQTLIDVNYKREQETYKNMFSSKKGIVDVVEKQLAKQPRPKQDDADREEIEAEVKLLVSQKVNEFSFEIREGWEKADFPEVHDVAEVFDKTFQTFKLLKQAGKARELPEVRRKLVEIKYAGEHLKMVMNMDFSRPTSKMLAMAREHNIDLASPVIINQFKQIQEQSLRDVQLMKQGKEPMSEEELQRRLQEDRL
jgi:tetratricopeptide (TPR) repeat protein